MQNGKLIIKNTMKKLSTRNSQLSILNSQFSSTGFTLIELIVVLSVAAVISVVGIAAFVSYNQTQSLNTTAADIANMFNVAKSRAASGVKPTTAPCSIEALNGYRISIIPSSTYKLDAVCPSGTSNILTSTLPNTIIFTSPPTTFTVPVLTGGFSGGGTTIVLRGFGKSKTITVDSLGNAR